MTGHKTRPGHRHTNVYGPERKIHRQSARYLVLETVRQLMDNDSALTVDDACALAEISDLTYLHACGDM